MTNDCIKCLYEKKKYVTIAVKKGGGGGDDGGGGGYGEFFLHTKSCLSVY